MAVIEIMVDDAQAHELRELARSANRPLQDFVRDVLTRATRQGRYECREADFVYGRPAQSKAFRAAFGLMGEGGVDGVEYQRKLRGEWPD